MKKIIFLNYTSDISGSSVALKRLIEAVENQYEFILVTAPGSYLENIAKKAGWNYRCYDIPLLVKSWSPRVGVNYFFRLKRLKKNITQLYQKEKADVLFINCLPNFGAGYLKPDNMHLVWWVHELEIHPQWIMKLMVAGVKKTAQAICCVSTPVMKLIGSQATYLPNGILSSEKVEYVNPLHGENLKIMWVGTASPRKGLHRLEGLVLKLQEHWNAIEVEIYSSCSKKYEPYYFACLEKIKSLGITVTHAENLNDDEIPWHNSKILFETSTLPESFSLPVLEGMSHGMLVVASGKGGMQDFAKHNKNVLFNADRDESLITQLKKLQSTPEQLMKLQKSARQTALSYDYGRLREAFEGSIK